MAVSPFNLSLLVIIVSSLSYSGFAQTGPVPLVQNALFCFNNKVIYSGCQDQYRLNENGNINVPLEATDSYCEGPCFDETQLVLRCVDRILSNFIFANGASVRDVGNALHSGCGYSSRRGNFDVGNYIGGDFYGEARKSTNLNSFYILALVLVFTFFII